MWKAMGKAVNDPSSLQKIPVVPLIVVELFHCLVIFINCSSE